MQKSRFCFSSWAVEKYVIYKKTTGLASGGIIEQLLL